jgi:hypothetical protein
VRFRDDNRGVTVQIGAVLFFAIVIIALSLYQATVVPSQNADVEYRHSQSVQGQMADVRNSLLQTAATGQTQTATVTLGTQYPSRVFLMNPPPATGTLSTDTRANDTMRVSNVVATDGETADYIDGAWSAPTKYLTYAPDYNEYDNAPNRVYESSLLYSHYPDSNASVPLTDQLLVRGDTITLVALNGSVSTTRSGSVSLSASPTSAPYQSVQVRPQDPSEPINVSVPTGLSAGKIRNSTSLGEDPNVTVTDGGPNRVVISLTANRTYTLQTARVDVGSQSATLGAHYLTVVDSGNGEVTVEARDRFNNPVDGATVSVNGSNPFVDSPKTTGVDGRATFEFKPGATGQGTLEILDGSEARERVTVSASAAGTGGNGSAGPYTVQWDTAAIESQTGVMYYSGNDTVVIDVGTQGTPDPAAFTAEVANESGSSVAGVNVDFATTNQSVVTFNPSAVDTNGSGESTTNGSHNLGRTTVYAEASGASDALGVKVIDSSGGGNNAQNVEIVQTELNNKEIDIQFRNNNPSSVTFTRARLDSYTEQNPPQDPNREAIDRVVYQSGPTLVEGEPLESISGPTLNGGTQEVTVDPKRIQQTGSGAKVKDAKPHSGDSFELTIEFDDGSTRTYTVTL